MVSSASAFICNGVSDVAVTSGIADDDDQVGGGDGGVTGVDAFLVDGQDGIGRELLCVR